MNRAENVYAVESSKELTRFVEDFIQLAGANDFVISNKPTMDMKKTLASHGGQVTDDFDLHMMQVCKPIKADKSLTANAERAILMPKFVHVFSAGGKTQIRYLSFGERDIRALVEDDPTFSDSLADTTATMREMIDQAK